MPLSLASPNWPAEHRGGEHLRRFGLHYFVLASLLVHGLALQLEFDFRPLFPVDRGISRLDVLLAPTRLPDIPTQLASQESINQSKLRRQTAGRPDRIELAPPAQPSPPSAVVEDARTLIERGKAMIDAGSRRQMLDPMFAPSAQKNAVASPLERATAIRGQTIEQLGDRLIRITTASGQRYCLQGLPEAATRDIPTPVLAVPGNCP